MTLRAAASGMAKRTVQAFKPRSASSALAVVVTANFLSAASGIAPVALVNKFSSERFEIRSLNSSSAS